MNHYRSEAIDQIMGALSVAQGKYKKLEPNQATVGEKFANLEAILDATRDALSQVGLGFYQYLDLTDEGSGAALLRTVIGHSSGQWISSVERIIHDKSDRRYGNSLSFHKRTQAAMLLGIAPCEHDPLLLDDNGVQQLEDITVKELRTPEHVKSDFTKKNTITKEQYNELMYVLDGYPEITKSIQNIYNVATLADLDYTMYHGVLAKIYKIKKNHEEAGIRPQ